MNGILQGTTPTLVITIPDEIPVSDIRALELAIKHNGAVTLHHLPDVTVNANDNSISRTFTEAETLALNPSMPLFYQLRIQTIDGIFGTEQSRLNVLDLISQEAIQ